MAARSQETAFSPNGQYFANVSTDSRLKIWECESGRAKQEFIPASHLSAACTCLVWAPSKQPEQSGNQSKKKRKSNGEEATGVAGSDIIALGTASGNILLYSLNRAELVHQLKGGHAGKVRSLCWNQDGSSLFSASSEKKIVEWDAVEGVIKCQWKVDKNPIFRMCMLQDNCTLVTAGRSIQCWNVETRSIVATFTGHTTDVAHLLPVYSPGAKGGYFLTAADADRCISAWRFVGEEKNGQSQASFTLQDDPLNFTVSRPISDKDPVVLAAVTVTGILHVFEHHLNGRSKKPLQPIVKIHIGSDVAGTARPLPVVSAYACGDADGNCVIVYGSLVRPGFEKMCYRNQDGMAYIVRRDPSSVDHSKSDVTSSALKLRTPILPADVKTLAPEYMVPMPASSEVGVAVGRKRRTQNSESNSGLVSAKDSLPMEQRLSALNLDKAVDAVAPPQADNMAQLLLQGLHSRDPKILQSVLDRGDAQIIGNTIRRIPVQAILPLILELTRMMQFRGHPNYSYAKWLRSLLEHHAGYLTSCPDLASVLTPLLALMTARTSLFPKLSQLRGRLHLMLGELEHRSEKEDATTTELPATALLVYREESSDEASEEGDWPLQSGSESEDQWDELSDYGENMDVNEAKDDSEQETDDENNSEEIDEEVEEASDNDIESVVENGLSD
ncbi:WD repeat-containing protein 43 [Daphnia magna]|uniref:WD repeat-containing protein 43 n=1 Tax=Daphnia magna TaxID=35525 RepID=A0A0P5ZSW7_9CRUS|nr:WD repeat-containing protein 43 [Daphnia magna]KZS04377.1 WD repeat-containing protein 43 [Daphnia magna]